MYSSWSFNLWLPPACLPPLGFLQDVFFRWSISPPFFVSVELGIFIIIYVGWRRPKVLGLHRTSSSTKRRTSGPRNTLGRPAQRALGRPAKALPGPLGLHLLRANSLLYSLSMCPPRPIWKYPQICRFSCHFTICTKIQDILENGVISYAKWRVSIEYECKTPPY